MKKIFLNKYFRFSFVLLGGILLGWLFFHSPASKKDAPEQVTIHTKDEIWTCAMHPQIRMHEPGKCPICGMDLIPLRQSGDTTFDVNAIHMTKEAAALANVLTSAVSKQNPVKDVRLYGKVQADERRLQSQVSYLPGRIEKLYVNFTGEGVRQGQPLALIYSPDLVTAQQELLETASTKSTQPMLYEAAREKLRQWKLTEDQITDIESSKKVKMDFEVFSNATGVVSARRVNNGDFISPGTVLFDIADLSHVWIMFDAYESDLPYLSQGQKLSFTLEAIPGTNYSGTITFIDPVIDPVTRVAKIRVEVNNSGGKLKPEMFATGIAHATLDQFRNNLVIPRSAVLWTGKRSVVYVKLPGDEPVFRMREVELGPALGNSYVVENGLMDGEEIVTQGTFSVDASAQLAGKPSMMNAEGGQTSAMPGMIMPGDTKTNNDNNTPVKVVPDETKPQKDNSMPGMDMPANPKSNNLNSKSMNFQKTAFGVSGNCGMCKSRIEKAALSVKGVLTASWDMKTKQLAVEYNSRETNVDNVQQAIAMVGHDTGKYKADIRVYEKLPTCCLYRK